MDTNNYEKIRERCDFILERYEKAKEKGLIDKEKIPELNEIAKKLYLSDDKVEMYSLYKQLKQGMYDCMYANDKVNYTEDREYNTEASETKKSKAIKLKSEDKKKFSDFWEEKKQKRLDKIQKQIDKKEAIKKDYERAKRDVKESSSGFDTLKINAANKAYDKRIASLESDITYLKNHLDYVAKKKTVYNRAIMLLSKPFSTFYSVSSWIKSKLGLNISKIANENAQNINKEVEKGFENIKNENSENNQNVSEKIEKGSDNNINENSENVQNVPEEVEKDFDNNINENSENVQNVPEEVENSDVNDTETSLRELYDFENDDQDVSIDVNDESDVAVPTIEESEQQNIVEASESEAKIDEIIKSVVADDVANENGVEEKNNSNFFEKNRSDVQVAPQRVVQDAPTLTVTELPKVTSEDLKNMLDEFKNDYKNSTVNEYGMGSDFEYEIDKEEIKEEATNAYGRYQEKETEIKNRVDELYKSQVPNGITLSEEQEKRLKDILRKQVEKEDAVAESMRKEEERRQKEEEMQRKVAEASEQYTNKYLETKKRQLQQLDMKKDKYDNAAVKANSQIDVLEEQLRILSSKTSELDEMFNESTNESSENHSISM